MSFSILHWLVILIVGLLWVVPLAHICRRVGIGWGLALLGFIPLFGVIALWIVAFSRWKIADADRQA